MNIILPRPFPGPALWRGVMSPFLRCLVLIAIVILFSRISVAQSVTSLASTDPVDDEYFSNLTPVNNKLYFVVRDVNDQDRPFALWMTDVNQPHAVLMRTFQTILSPINYNGTLFFIADDGESGRELWKTNGTSEGTVRVKDIRAGAAGSRVNRLTLSNNLLFFAAGEGVHGVELWKSNGTAAGTLLVKDIMPSVESSNPTFLTNVNGTLFFSANNGVNGYELWKSDGTPGGTKLVNDIRPGFQVSSGPANLTNKNGMLIFTASSATGRELWKSDGSQTGTLLIRDIRAGIGSSNPGQLTVVDSAVYFAAYDGVHGLELWKSDGTTAGTVLLKDLTPGPGSDTNYAAAHLSELTAINHKLYFIATTPGPSIYQATQSLWVSDGTDEGTRRLTLYPEISFLKDPFSYNPRVGRDIDDV